jgi:hypothetical protein
MGDYEFILDTPFGVNLSPVCNQVWSLCLLLVPTRHQFVEAGISAHDRPLG